MSKTGAAFSVRFLRNGDQVVVVRNIVHANGDGAALYQTVDTTSGVVAPDWTVSANQPIIKLGVRSSAGYPVALNGVKWAFDGTTLKFTLNGANWVTATNNAKFQARVNGDTYELKIVGDIASKSVVANKQISYEVGYKSNGMTDVIQGSVDILIQTAGSDSHMVQVTANRVELDDTNTSATLTAEGLYGTQAVTIGSNGYTVKWFQDGQLLAGQTSSTLNVTRDMVSGGSLFVAVLYLNGNAVAQDSQRINDIADEYQIVSTPANAGSSYVGLAHNAVYNLSLTRNGSAFGGNVTFTWQIFNALGEVKKSDGQGASVTILPEYCAMGSGADKTYSDCDVVVMAEFY